MTAPGSVGLLAKAPLSDFARNSNSWRERAHIFLSVQPSAKA
jgi:hypothetical protein